MFPPYLASNLQTISFEWLGPFRDDRFAAISSQFALLFLLLLLLFSTHQKKKTSSKLFSLFFLCRCFFFLLWRSNKHFCRVTKECLRAQRTQCVVAECYSIYTRRVLHIFSIYLLTKTWFMSLYDADLLDFQMCINQTHLVPTIDTHAHMLYTF